MWNQLAKLNGEFKENKKEKKKKSLKQCLKQL